MDISNNIILIGMMGSGKSTVGQILANTLELNFVDLDETIVQKQGMKIPEIFENFGETFFRTLESSIIDELSDCRNKVISTGGGVVKDIQNLENLKKVGAVFYLSADSNTLYERIKGDINRPLLKTKTEFEQILNERENGYAQAHHKIDATQKPQEIVQEIIEIFKGQRSWN